jgi:immunoglobulin-binding protein 1
MSNSLTLPQLLAHTLTTLLPIFTDTLSSSSPTAQSLLVTARTDLDLIERILSSLGVFSQNETLEDVADGEMVFMVEQWVRGEVEGRVATNGIQQRLKVLERAKVSAEDFAGEASNRFLSVAKT